MSSAEGTSDALPNIFVTLLTELLPLKIDLEEEEGTLEVPSRLLVAQEEEVEAREEEGDALEVASGLLVAKKGEMEVEAPQKEKPPLGTFPNMEAPFSCSRGSWFLDDLSAFLKRAGEGFFWFSAASTTLFPDDAFMISDFDSSEGDFLISLIPFLVLIMSATAFSMSSKRSGSSSGTASAFVSSKGSSGLSIELSMDAEVTDRWYWNFMISIIRSISGILPAFMTMKFSMNLSLHISSV